MRLALADLAERGASQLPWVAPRTRGALYWHGLAERTWPDPHYTITDLGRAALAEGRFDPR